MEGKNFSTPLGDPEASPIGKNLNAVLSNFLKLLLIILLLRLFSLSIYFRTYRVTQKVKRLIDQKTKAFFLILKMSFAFNKKYLNLDFETKFAQIRDELTEIRQFKN